jgi:hypothetical protein
MFGLPTTANVAVPVACTDNVVESEPSVPHVMTLVALIENFKREVGRGNTGPYPPRYTPSTR